MQVAGWVETFISLTIIHVFTALGVVTTFALAKLGWKALKKELRVKTFGEIFSA